MGRTNLEDPWNETSRKLLVWGNNSLRKSGVNYSVKEAKELAAKDKNGLSDPYVKVCCSQSDNLTVVVLLRKTKHKNFDH
jgi:Ca2+-dependent lipid-binding protein